MIKTYLYEGHSAKEVPGLEHNFDLGKSSKGISIDYKTKNYSYGD